MQAALFWAATFSAGLECVQRQYLTLTSWLKGEITSQKETKELLKLASRGGAIFGIHFMGENLRHREAVACQILSDGDISVQGTGLN